MASLGSNTSSIRALQKEFKDLNESPVEGFKVEVKNEGNMFEWDVAIFGPPGTLYESGYLKAKLKFPNDYPYLPPSMTFLTKMWHPNIYEDGRVCISILHPPGDDPVSGELPSERWNPTQNVRTILLSVISLLNEPNTSSPANVDASVMYRKWKEGKCDDYCKVVRQQVEATKKDAEAEGVVVPIRIEDYVIKQSSSPKQGKALDQDVFGFHIQESNLDDDLTVDEEDEDTASIGQAISQ